ncbi:MAG: right-handed parallel beta-helix repeat-containing protein [Candidatus Saccharibacteria bacterium]
MATKSKTSKKKPTARVAKKSLVTKSKLNYGLLAIIAGVLILVGGLYVLLTRAATPADYTTAGQATAALDNSGKTIPKTNYAIPAGATYMSPTGNDANDGKSLNTPVKTINSAVSKTASGGTIVMRGGDYRDWYSTTPNVEGAINKSITIQAYPGESPWFNGADIVSDGWTSDGAGHWYRTWETPSFCGNSYYNYSIAPYTPQRRADGTTDPNIKETKCMYEDAANDPAYPMAGNPQQAFINDVRQQEVASLAQATAGKFYYDWTARRMYIGTDPNGKKVELSARPAAFILAGADTDSHQIKGIGFKRYATNGGESTTTGGAVYFARKALIENTVFTENATGGFVYSNPKPGTILRSSVVAFNGGTGMGANGASKTPGARNDIVVEGNIFNSNNWERGGLYCNRACGPSGIKMAHMVGFTVKNNVFENQFSRAPGMWCDQNCSDMVTVNNVVRNNGGPGIFYEVGNKGIIANNLVYNNDDDGITVASANVKVYNNTVVDKYGSRVQGINVYDDIRTPPSATAVWPWYDGAHDNGPSTAGVELVNNLVVAPDTQNGARLVLAVNGSGALNTTADQFFTAFDYNAYYRLNTSQNLYYYGTTDGYKSVADMQRLTNNKFEMNSFSVEANSPFVDRAGQDFRLKTDALAATQKGKALPADVAAALGLPAGTVPVRGAIYPTTAPTTTTTTPPPTTTVTPPPPPADTTAPVGPASIAASSVSQTSLILNWPAATDNVGVTSYVVTRNGTQIATGTSLSTNDTGLTAGTTYQYKVVARDAAGNTSTGATLSVTTLAPSPTPTTTTTITPPPPPPADTTAPSAPTNVKGNIVWDAFRFSYYTNLSWGSSTDNVGVTSYVVKRNGTTLGTPTKTNFQDYNIAANTYYTYDIQARDAAGNTSTATSARLVGRCFLIWCWAE